MITVSTDETFKRVSLVCSYTIFGISSFYFTVYEFYYFYINKENH